MKFPLVLDLAADGVPVAVACFGPRLLQASLLRLEGDSSDGQGLG